MMRLWKVVLFALALCPLLALSLRAQTDWPYVGGDANGLRYSTLDQINRKNVKQLEVAWTFHTGGLREKYNSAIQCTPSQRCCLVRGRTAFGLRVGRRLSHIDQRNANCLETRFHVFERLLESITVIEFDTLELSQLC